MKTLYHGTAADNLESIRQNGFVGMSGRQLWQCSAGKNYFWCNEELDDDEDNYRAFNLAKDNSTVALFRAKDCRRLVFKLEIPDDYFEENFLEDTSCQNMSGAVMATGTVPFKFVTEIWRDFESLDLLRFHFGVLINCNPLSIKSFSRIEAMVIKVMSHDCSDIYDFLDELEMEKISL